jgi:phosphoribosyl-dephospho-CoA transferase
MGRGLKVRTHTLLRISSAAALRSEAPAPAWLSPRLQCAPWVVVRRAEQRAGWMPVGVRGARRAERFAAWLPCEAVLESVTAMALARRRGWSGHARAARVPALAALDVVESLLAARQLAGRWGPAGSVAFELASGCATATVHSDLDLILEPAGPLTCAAAAQLVRELGALAVCTDVLLETPHGAVALTEFARGRPPYLLRTPRGACLGNDPWADAVAAA